MAPEHHCSPTGRFWGLFSGRPMCWCEGDPERHFPAVSFHRMPSYADGEELQAWRDFVCGDLVPSRPSKPRPPNSIHRLPGDRPLVAPGKVEQQHRLARERLVFRPPSFAGSLGFVGTGDRCRQRALALHPRPRRRCLAGLALRLDRDRAGRVSGCRLHGRAVEGGSA